jgi:nucleoside-diphosphate-sugar epimerase
MLELARQKGAVFLLASTSEVYGDPEVNPQPEGYWGHVNPIGPRSCYDEAKRYAEALTMAYHRRYELNVKIARIFNTYGPLMRPDDGRVVSNFCWQVLHNKPLTIYGDGTQTRSFCYIDDMVEGLYRLLLSDETGPINLGNPDEVSIVTLAKEIIELAGSQSQIVFKPLPVDDPKVRRPDIRLAKERLGWEPKVPRREGLLRTLDYFQGLKAL